MKKLLWMAFCSATLLITGCSKDDDGGSSVNNFITFTLDGTAVACTSGFSLSFPETKQLTVNGAWSGGNIKLEVFEDLPLVEGTYTFLPNKYRRAVLTVGGTTYTAGSAGTSTVSGFGNIIITDIDPAYVSGEFEFETGAVSGVSKSVLNGSFKVAR